MVYEPHNVAVFLTVDKASDFLRHVEHIEDIRRGSVLIVEGSPFVFRGVELIGDKLAQIVANKHIGLERILCKKSEARIRD
jgi:hypothetical protein